MDKRLGCELRKRVNVLTLAANVACHFCGIAMRIEPISQTGRPMCRVCEAMQDTIAQSREMRQWSELEEQVGVSPRDNRIQLTPEEQAANRQV